MGCDEPIAPTTAMLAAMKKSEQSIDRNRGAPHVRFPFVIMEVPSSSLPIRDHSHPSRFYPATREVVNNFVPRLLRAATFRGAGASRVLAMASSPWRTFFCPLDPESVAMRLHRLFRREAETNTRWGQSRDMGNSFALGWLGVRVNKLAK